MDPLTISAIAAGAQAVGGGLQALFSGRKKRESELNAFAKQSPLYTPNKSINDYYQQALNRYSENPYQSQQYQVGAKNIQRATAQGLGAMQDRRGGIGGASRLAEAQMSGLQNLGAGAEAQRNARFGQYGQAAQAKAGEDYRAFDINQMTPYNRQLQLKQMASQAANSRFNAGLSMAGQGLSNLAQVGVAGEAYSGGQGNANKTNPELSKSITASQNEFDVNRLNLPKLDSSLRPAPMNYNSLFNAQLRAKYGNPTIAGYVNNIPTW